MKQKTLATLLSGICLLTSCLAAGEKSYPEHWGTPPMKQTRDLRELPGGYGKGSSTMVKWITENMAKDAANGVAEAAPESKADEIKSLDPAIFGEFVARTGKATYEMKDGVLVGTTAKSSPNTFWTSGKEFADFELTFEVKLSSPRLNSGVQIRSKVKDGKFNGKVYGPQVEIEDGGKGKSESGYIYGEGMSGWITPKKSLIAHDHYKSGKWNKYRVLAKGANIKVWVNGEMVTDLTDETLHEKFPTGVIGFQVHGVGNNGPFQVMWRNVQLTELKPE